jgi:subtilase family serine protease
LYDNSLARRVFATCISVFLAFILGIASFGWQYQSAVADSRPDLVVLSINTSPSAPAVDDSVTITVTVKNQGTSDAAVSQVVCYIDSIILDTESIGSLAPATMATASFTWQAEPGSHVIKAVADPGGLIAESDETNNTMTYSLTTLAPDLIIQSLSWSPASPSKGDSITFSVNIRNQGNSRSRTNRLIFYINGTSRGFQDVYPLDPGSSTTKTYNWVAQSGQHNIRAVVDVNDIVDESNEANNEYTCTFSTLPPDLIIDSIVWYPENPSKNDDVSFNATIKNQGAGRSDPCQLAYYIDGDFQSLLMVNPLEAGTSENVTFSWNALSDLHEIKLIVDYNNTLVESDENNNTRTVGFMTLRPDLFVKDITWSPLDAGVGDDVTLTATIANQGAGRAELFRVVCYVNGRYAGFVDIQQLNADAETTASFSWTATNSTNNISVVVDSDSLLVESNEDNNKTTTSISFLPPDLSVHSIAWEPEYPSIGDIVTFSVNLTNQGGGKAEGFYVAYYIDDTFLSTSFITGIFSEGSVNATFTWQVQEGRHVFRALADYNKAVNENNEHNNEKSVTITPHMPDLAIGSITWSPADMPLGGEVRFSIDIENLGTLEAGPSRVAYYVDGVITGYTDIDSLGDGSRLTDQFLWVVAAGSHTIEVVTDSSGRVTEIDEDNNMKVINIPPPDLIVTDTSWSPAQAAIGDNVTFTATVKNQADSRTQPFRIDCYVDGWLVGTDDLPPLDPSGSAAASFVWAAESGKHNVRIVADSTNRVIEVDETNNEYITVFSTLTPDLYIQDVDWLMESPLGDDDVILTITVKNQGTDAAAASRLSYTIDDDTPVVEDIGSIAAGGSRVMTFTLYLKAGSHTVVMEADSLDEVIELDETNNAKTLTFSTVAPDLVVRTLSWSPRDAAAGDEVTISVKVENQGRAKAAGATLALNINGAPVASLELGDLDIGDIVSKDFTWTALAGLQEISVYADADGMLTESNETNNTSSRTITISDIKTPAETPVILSSGPSADKGFFSDYWWLILLVAALLGVAAFISAYKAFRKE